MQDDSFRKALYDAYNKDRDGDDSGATRDSSEPVRPPTPAPAPQAAAPQSADFRKVPNFEYMREFIKFDKDKNMKLNFDEFLAMQTPETRAQYGEWEIRNWFNAADLDNDGNIDPNEFFAMKGLPPLFQPKEVGALISDTDTGYARVPWWQQNSGYTEAQRKDRRTIFMHDDWVRHRSNQRFLRNIKSLPSSGINQALKKEIIFVTSVAIFVTVSNMFSYSYQDLGGVAHAQGGLPISLPALPFSVLMPALSLLLVFRTNTAYSRWNEARTLWGGLINNCRNVVRQSNTFFADDPRQDELKVQLAGETAAFIRALKNFLRGPTDDVMFRSELYEIVDQGRMSIACADAMMLAANRPMYALSAMSATLRKADLDEISRARIDQTISTLVDLTGANERIFKSPIPLLYTRLLSRFLTIFLIFLPFALWGPLSESWNHWATIPVTFGISFFLFGIEEVGIQIEEPFSILPLEAFCNGAIAATNEEMLNAEKSGIFD